MCLYLCLESGADKVFIMDCMTVLLLIFQTMKSHFHHAVLAGWMFSTVPAIAGTYPLGDMTCPEIGQFASQAMQWREDGVRYKEAKTRLDALRPDESVEKKNMRVVMQLVYGNYGDSWTVESAGSTMKMDCESGR